MRGLLSFVPAPLKFRFGGAVFLCSEFTIRSIARLEAWVASVWVDPMDEIRAQIALADDADRIDLAFAALDIAENGSPQFGEPRFFQELWTPDGLMEFAWIAFSQHDPTISRDQVGDAVVQADLAEWGRLQRIVWANDPLAELNRIIEGDRASTNRDPIKWAELYCRVAKTAPLSPLEFPDLTFSQVLLLLSGGKPPEFGPTVGPHESIEAAAIRRRTLYLESLERSKAKGL